jgi:hypothetical protein
VNLGAGCFCAMSPRGWPGNNCFAAGGSPVGQKELGAVTAPSSTSNALS